MLTSLKTLLQSIVDYAGLYPPAQLDLRSAMENYAQSAATSDAWMLSRFVLPAARLENFYALLPEFALAQWSLSVVVKNLEEMEQVFTVQSRLAASENASEKMNLHRVKIAALEFTPRSPEEIRTLIPRLPPDTEAFFELPLDPFLTDSILALKGTAAAKVRTGGITEAAFPNRKSLAQWICTCAEAKIPFKATAGLHHPFPGSYRLTDEPESPTAPMHGFLNVAVASAFAYHQAIDFQEILQLLEIDARSDSLQFQDDRLLCKLSQRVRQLDLTQLQTARQQFFRAFGSCSFHEPIDDLRQHGLIRI